MFGNNIIVQSKSELVYTQATTRVAYMHVAMDTEVCGALVQFGCYQHRLLKVHAHPRLEAKDLSCTCYPTLVFCAWWFNYPGRLLKRFRVDFRPLKLEDGGLGCLKGGEGGVVGRVRVAARICLFQ